MDDKSESSGDFEDWGSEDADPPVPSFIDERLLESAQEAWSELSAKLGSDVLAIAAEAGARSYELVRLVNYIRHTASNARLAGSEVVAAIRAALSPEVIGKAGTLWTDEQWLVPVLADDPMLMSVVGAGDADEEDAAAPAAVTAAIEQPTTGTAPADSSAVAILQAQLQKARALIARLLSDREQEGSDGSDDESTAEEGTATGGEGAGAGAAASSSASSRARVPEPSQDNDTYYFDSYASIGIHAEMLKDAVRTESYRDAILRNPQWFAGKVVLDVGCGTGILSMFAAQAGAKCVVALDASNIIHDARANVAANGLDGVIRCVHGKAEDVPLHTFVPAEYRAHADTTQVFDIIVSEWMGYGLLYESMLGSVLAVRDKYLAPGGRMLPSQTDIRLGALSSPRMWADRVDYWSNVYGFNMKQMVRHVFPEASVEVVPAEAVVSASPHALVAALRTVTMAPAEQDIVDSRFSLDVAADGDAVPIHALVIWFDTFFSDDPLPAPGAAAAAAAAAASSATATAAAASDELPELEDCRDGAPSTTADASTAGKGVAEVQFTTGPHGTPTHWQQTVLLFQRPLQLPAGRALSGQISMIREPKNPREYRIVVKVDGAASGCESVQQTWYLR